MQTGFEYYAFISYKREDEKWGKWLQNNLEAYKLPSIIRKEKPNLPKKIRPIFRDKTDLGAGILTETLQKELERSQYLIVICSPASTQSEWVGKEIESFIEMGRGKKIIPFIVAGTPYDANPDQECFHPVLKEKLDETLGINVNEIGKKQALIKVAARLLDLRFDSLWNRYLRRQRQQRLLTTFILLSLFAGIIYTWDYFRIKTTYYADYVDKWGLSEGIMELSGAQMSKRSAHYRFESSQNKLRRVVYANSSGRAINHTNTEYTDRPSIQEFIYANNRLIATELKNAWGNTMATYFWGGKNFDRIDLKQDIETQTSTAVVSSFTSLSSYNFIDKKTAKAKIKRYKLTRNDDGYIIRKEFKRNNGDDTTDASDANGITGFEYLLDSLNRPLTVRYLTANGRYGADLYGIWGRNYRYDPYGNLCMESFFGEKGKPIYNEYLYVSAVNQSDKNGNIIKVQYLDTDNKLCYRKGGISQEVYTYDSNGVLTESISLDTDGNPCMNNEKYSKISHTIDKYGNAVETFYYDATGNPCIMKDGCAFYKSKYNKHGDQIESSAFDINGHPVISIYGYHKGIAEYDEQGHLITVKTYGTNGELTTNSNGFSIFKNAYENGNLKQTTYFDTNQKLCYDANKVAGEIYQYDEDGNLVATSYRDINNNQCNNKKGVASEKYYYDERGNKIGTTYQGMDGKPCYSNKGYATIEWKYDERGNNIEIAYKNIDGSLANPTDGIAKTTMKYDPYGNLIEKSYFDANDAPKAHEDGFVKITRKYDERRNIIEENYWSLYEKPFIYPAGYSGILLSYDEKGNNIEVSYQVDDALCMTSDGYCKWKAMYDEKENMIEMSFFDLHGNLSVSKNGYACRKMEYNATGNLIKESYFGTDGSPATPSWGNSSIILVYDNKNHVIEKQYFGVNGEPSMEKGNYWRITYEYDEKGNETEEIFWGTDGQPSLLTKGYAKITQKYDPKGNKIETSNWNANGKITADIESGIAAITYKYDIYNNVIEITCIAPDGNPFTHKIYGWAKKEIEYNGLNQIIRESFYAPGGKLIMPANPPYAELKATRDEVGNLEKIECFDAHKRVIPSLSFSTSSLKTHVNAGNANVNKEALDTYINIVKNVSKAEMQNVPSSLGLEYEELVSIGVIAIQVLIKNKTLEQLKSYNSAYIATAVRWAIQNELSIRYKTYEEAARKRKNEYQYLALPDSINVQQLAARESIYQTVLAIDTMDKENEELTEMGDVIREYISRLPEKERIVMELRFYKNRELREIAQEVNKTLPEVAETIISSLNRIKEKLHSEGVHGY